MVCFDFLRDQVIVCDIDQDGDGRVILGGRPQHRGTADIDVFYCLFPEAVGTGDGLCEGVEINHHKINGLNTVVCHLRVIDTPPPQQTTVNPWM